MSQNTRDKFIATGSRLYPQLGYHQLSVRVLAAETGLSSGMFHHLFKNKDAFIIEMLSHHNDMIALHLDNIELPENCFARLRVMAQALACNMRDNLQLIHRVFADSAIGVEAVNDFIRTAAAQRLDYFGKLLEECARLDNSVPASTVQRLAYLSSAVHAPMIIGLRFHQAGLLPETLGSQVSELLTDEAIGQRIDWCLQSLFPNYKKYLK